MLPIQSELQQFTRELFGIVNRLLQFSQQKENQNIIGALKEYCLLLYILFPNSFLQFLKNNKTKTNSLEVN